MTITQRKRQLRMAVRRDEQLISICDRARSDQAVAIQVLALPEYRRAQSLFCFVSIQLSVGRELYAESAEQEKRDHI